MQKIADARADPMSRFHNALYAGDVLGRIAVLRDVGLRKCNCSALHFLDFIPRPRSPGIPYSKNEWFGGRRS
jgi:hypothetical protein